MYVCMYVCLAKNAGEGDYLLIANKSFDSLHHRVQNGSGAHPVSYAMGTRGCFPGDKAAGAWSWPVSSI
jgi:hypothetical protein